MSRYDDDRAAIVVFAESLKLLVEGSASVTGAFVVLIHNNGRSTGIRSPSLERDPINALVEINRCRASFRNTAGILEREILERIAAVTKLEDETMDGRA